MWNGEKQRGRQQYSTNNNAHISIWTFASLGENPIVTRPIQNKSMKIVALICRSNEKTRNFLHIYPKAIRYSKIYNTRYGIRCM